VREPPAAGAEEVAVDSLVIVVILGFLSDAAPDERAAMI
jgi:hypothetical protein